MRNGFLLTASREEHTPDNELETQVRALTTTAVDEKCIVWSNKFVML